MTTKTDDVAEKKAARKRKLTIIAGAIGTAALAAWHFLFGAGVVPAPPPPALEVAVEAVVVPPAVPVEQAVPPAVEPEAPVEGSKVE